MILTCCIVADHTEKKHYWCNICLIWFSRYDYHKNSAGARTLTRPDRIKAPFTTSRPRRSQRRRYPCSQRSLN